MKISFKKCCQVEPVETGIKETKTILIRLRQAQADKMLII